MPEVSVIIPVYNVERYLRECLNSVINQTLTDIEIICVNDGSTDRSLEILQEYAAADKRIKIISYSNNKGGGYARNKALDAAVGKYLAFLDSDDFYNIDYLEKMVSCSIRNNSDIVVCFANSFNNETGETYLMPWSLRTNLLPNKETFNYNDIPDRIFNFAQNWSWNKLFHKKFIETYNIRFQNLHRTNDLLFTCSALVLANNISIIEEPLVNYRVGMKGNCQSTNHLYPLDFYDAFKELRKWLIESKYWDCLQKSYTKWALNGCAYNINSIKDEKIKNKVTKKVFTEGLKELNLENADQAESKEFYKACIRNNKAMSIFGIKLKFRVKILLKELSQCIMEK